MVEYMQDKCPPRSGDSKLTMWMTKDADDFYHEDYRSLDDQLVIYEIALTRFPSLAASCRAGSNSFHRNLRTYLEAKENGRVQDLKVHLLDAQRTQLTPDNAVGIVAGLGTEDEADRCEQQVDTSPPGDEGDLDAETDEPGRASKDSFTLYPRAYRTFYRRILVGQRLWKRPPENHCDRCATFVTVTHRHDTLKAALCTLASSPGYQEAAEFKSYAMLAASTKPGKRSEPYPTDCRTF